MQHCNVWRALFSGLSSPQAELQASWSTEAGIQDLAYVTQLLLTAADDEARAGHTGSKAVRTTALRAVCAVLEAVKDPQPLSYLLPGLVGGLSKAILAGEQATPSMVVSFTPSRNLADSLRRPLANLILLRSCHVNARCNAMVVTGCESA